MSEKERIPRSQRGWQGFHTVLIACVVCTALGGCGSSNSSSSSAEKPDLGPHAAYFRELHVAVAPLGESRTREEVNTAAKAGQYRRAATATETYISELRAYLRRLQSVKAPKACVAFHKGLERIERVGIRMFAGTLPFYRRKKRGPLLFYELRAHRRMNRVSAPVTRFEAMNEIPC